MKNVVEVATLQPTIERQLKGIGYKFAATAMS